MKWILRIRYLLARFILTEKVGLVLSKDEMIEFWILSVNIKCWNDGINPLIVNKSWIKGENNGQAIGN